MVAQGFVMKTVLLTVLGMMLFLGKGCLTAPVTPPEIRFDYMEVVTGEAPKQSTHESPQSEEVKYDDTGSMKSTHSRQLLMNHLMQPMHKQQNSDHLPTNVRLKLIPIKIQDLNEKNEVLETTLRLQVTWRDSRLSWEPALFNNATEMVIPGNAVWSPDIAILNSVSDIYHVVRDTRFEMKVENDGRVWWHPTGIVKTYCKLHLRYFPFDRQKCKIIIESPTLDIRLMNLTLRHIDEPVDTVMFISGETWDLLAVTGHNIKNKVTSKTTFARVEFAIHIERARIYHLLNVIFPAIFLSLVQVMFFMLPATHPQRVGSTTTTLLSVVVFQSVAVSQLPKTSSEVPILAIYIFIVTFISGLSVCTSIFMSRFALYAEHNHKMPNWLRRLRRPTTYFRRICACLRRHREHPPTEASIQLQDIRSGDAQQTSTVEPDEALFSSWSEVAHTFDAILLVLALFTAIIAPILLFVIIPMAVHPFA